MTDAPRPAGFWETSKLVTPEQVEHDKPLLAKALEEGRHRVRIGTLRRRTWTFNPVR